MSDPAKPKTLDELVLLMVSGMPARMLDDWARQAFGDQAERMKADAKQRINLAANYNRDELLGAAILIREDLGVLYEASRTGQGSLELSLATGKLQEAYMWISEHVHAKRVYVDF